MCRSDPGRSDKGRRANDDDLENEIPGGAVVVSNEIELVLDVEAILLDDLERTGASE
jgi:hypothetical protein